MLYFFFQNKIIMIEIWSHHTSLQFPEGQVGGLAGPPHQC